MTSGFVYLRPTKLAFVRSNGRPSIASQEAWARLYKWLDQSEFSRLAGPGYGLNRSHQANGSTENCSYDACIELRPEMEGRLPRDFRVQTLPGGPYARHGHIGSRAGLGEALVQLRDGWMMQRKLLICTDRPVVEIFLSDARRVAEEKLRTDICVPVKAVRRADAA